MDIEEQFRYRRVVCVIVRVGSEDSKVLARPARLFDATPGTRGGMLSRDKPTGTQVAATSMRYSPHLHAVYRYIEVHPTHLFRELQNERLNKRRAPSI